MTGPTPQGTVASLRRPRCAQLFIIYPGLEIGMGGRRTTFLSLTQQAGIGDRNLGLVADPYRENYARGVSPEIPDLPSLLEWHRALLRELPQVAEIYTLGYSSGGYGALLFGHLMGAKKVWAFVPRSARLETADIAKAFLKQHLESFNGTTEYVIFYSLANRRDCAFADYIAHCPGVVLTPYCVPPPDPQTGDGLSIKDAQMHYHRNLLPAIVGSGELRHLMPPFRPAAGVVDAGVA